MVQLLRAYYLKTEVNLSDLQDEAELYGRTIRVNMAKPQRLKEGYNKPGTLLNCFIVPRFRITLQFKYSTVFPAVSRYFCSMV